MKRTPTIVGVLALVALALLIVACGSDPSPTSAPAAMAPPTVAPTATALPQPTATPSSATPPATSAPAQVPTRAAPAPTAAPIPSPTPVEPEETDPSDAYFAMDRVLEVVIEINADDWDTLRHQTRTFEDLMAEIEKYNLSRPFADIYDWFSATVTIDGETHTEVGVRKKGFLGSQSDAKPSLKLRYDKYVDDQSLGGVMERMTLNNSIQDPSMVNTCLAYQAFAAAGNPAPRCNFATVTVNGKDLGLYVHLEELKKPFLERHFDSAEGNLYEGTVSDFTPSHRGTVEKKTNEDEDDWADVDAVVAALQDPGEAGIEALAQWVDLERFLSFWATEVLAGHWDGYAGDRNNYHFYRQPDGKFVFIPWGADDTFHLKDDPNPFDNISDPPPSVLALSAIPNRLYNIPEWRAKYAERLKDILDTAWDEEALLSSVDTMAAIVQEHGLPNHRAKAAADTERVRKFILKRKGEILADLTPEPPDWPEPEGPDAPAGSITPEAWEIHFETVWGSSKNPNPFKEGEITYLNIDADPPDAMAVIAGEASAEERAILPGAGEPVSISILSLESDGFIAGITLVLPADKLAGGVTLVLGKDAIGGVVWIIPPGSVEPNWFLPLSGGRLELVEASGKPGAVISGRFYGSIGGAPVPGGGDETERLESGTVEVNFETAWGTNKSATPLEEGTVSSLLGDGEEESVDGLGVIAGVASSDEQLLLPGVEDLASIVVLGLEEDGSLVGMTLVMSKPLLAGGAALVIGEDVITGGVWTLPPGGVVPDNFWPFVEGTLTLAEAGTAEGAAISGSFSGTFSEKIEPLSPTRMLPPVGGRYEDGELELRFETAWRSNQNANPFANPFEEGQVTYFWRMNGVGNIQSTEGLAATAGHASPEETAGFGIENAASVTILGLGAEGSVEGLTLVLPLAQLTSGASITIGQDACAAVWRIPAGAAAPEQVVPAVKGQVEFAEAGVEPGATIVGYIHATFSLEDPPVPTKCNGGAVPPGTTTPSQGVTDIGLVINEVAAKGDPFDWFELYNASASHIALANFVVADDLQDAGKRVAFPSDLVVAPGGYLQVEVDRDNWAGFKLGGDEELGVWTSEGVPVDSVDWEKGDANEGQSYARVPDRTGEFQTVGNPTAGAANQSGN